MRVMPVVALKPVIQRSVTFSIRARGQKNLTLLLQATAKKPAAPEQPVGLAIVQN